MIFKLLTEFHFEFLSLKGGCRGLSKSTLVKMSNCWKFHAVAQFISFNFRYPGNKASTWFHVQMAVKSDNTVAKTARSLPKIIQFRVDEKNI